MVTYPEDWREEKIEDIFSVITDYVAAGSFADLSQNVVYSKSPDYAQLVRTKDIKSKFTNNDFVYINKSAYEYLWRVHFDKPIIIMPNIGNCGEVYYLEPHMLPYKNSALGPNAIMLKKTTHDMKFLSYALERDDFQSSLADITSPSGQTKFNKTALAKISIVIPECFSEQQAIASVLSDFDEHIGNLSGLIEKKKAIRDGSLDDLVSGRTRLDGFTDEWEEEPLQKICNIYDGTHQTPKYTISGIKFVSVENISDIYNSDKYISQADYDRDFRVRPEKGDVLMTRIGDIGTSCIVGGTEPIAYYVSLALFKEIAIDSDFLNHYIESKSFKKELDDRTLHHATPKKINKGEIGKCKIRYPKNEDEQKAIASILTAMDEEIESLKIEKEKMIQIKEGAMDDLLTGRVRLKV
ncbi:restriction endonuclease subunit S [Streptococcus parasuis]|uniref:restriction endonuclease subunit S n=1 Tax=Streptococcus parasuis TaxID=1501662 RepID=UPI0023795840|nr:restriction endonuclease subunit S [Streptococcus parasuis]WDN61093.1 restriction endonuclease subunit S [Streptococcus parasuis]